MNSREAKREACRLTATALATLMGPAIAWPNREAYGYTPEDYDRVRDALHELLVEMTGRATGRGRS